MARQRNHTECCKFKPNAGIGAFGAAGWYGPIGVHLSVLAVMANRNVN
jgi:hypothetical protein